MEELLDEGLFCRECGWFETGTVFDGQESCNGCGCRHGQHVKAKVVTAE